jgi:hypothetical protein
VADGARGVGGRCCFCPFGVRGAEPGGHAGGGVVGAEGGGEAEVGGSVLGRVSLREMGGGEMEKKGGAYIVGPGGGEGGVVAFGLGGWGELGVNLRRGRVEVVGYGFRKLWGEWGKKGSN